MKENLIWYHFSNTIGYWNRAYIYSHFLSNLCRIKVVSRTHVHCEPRHCGLQLDGSCLVCKCYYQWHKPRLYGLQLHAFCLLYNYFCGWCKPRPCGLQFDHSCLVSITLTIGVARRCPCSSCWWVSCCRNQ